jgi:hypothetical protein
MCMYVLIYLPVCTYTVLANKVSFHFITSLAQTILSQYLLTLFYNCPVLSIVFKVIFHH